MPTSGTFKSAFSLTLSLKSLSQKLWHKTSAYEIHTFQYGGVDLLLAQTTDCKLVIIIQKQLFALSSPAGLVTAFCLRANHFYFHAIQKE